MSFTEFDEPGQGRRDKKDPPADTHTEPRLPTRRSEQDAPPALEADRDFPSLLDRISGTQYATRSSRSRRWLKRLFIVVCVVFLVAAGALVGTGAWLSHSMRASLPQIDGALRVSGLAGNVTVARDEHGVPSIQAANLDDLLFAQGFVTAQDRLWQMDVLRRHAAGELAEILGSSLIEHDRTQRILQMRAAAERAIAALPPGQLHQLEAYTHGVNALIEGNGDHLPVEFHLLHYKPAPWTPRDSLLVSLAMFQDLSNGFPVKMKREALAAHLPAQLLADLYPVGSWRDQPPTRPRPDLTTPRVVEEIPLDDTQVKLHAPPLPSPRDLLRAAALLPGAKCEGCRAGSNNWAVAGSRSASGFPLVSNDMHLSLSLPDIWYEAGLHSAASNGATALDAVGFTLPGVPFVIVGRNAHVAWSFTNLGADVQDIRMEHIRGPGDHTEFQKPDGTWAKAGHAAEHIRVRGGKDVTLDVLTTTANVGGIAMTTPIISPLYPSERRMLSLAWTPYDPANLTEPFLAVNAATDGASLVAAFASFGGPSLNLVYADDAKHIGYHALGRIPVRGPADRRLRPSATPLPSDQPAPMTKPVPENEEGDDTPTKPEARFVAPALFAQPHLLQAAFRPTRRRARREPARKAAPEIPAAVEAPVLQAPPEIEYTIGSAISSVPVDALDASQQWSGYIPYSELPSVVDPPTGILATANARITPDNYAYSITNDWTPAYRVERIDKLLAGRKDFTPAGMLALENDVHSEFDLLIAQRLAYALDHASAGALGKDVKRLHQAADILRQWDGEVTPDSPAAAVVLAFREEVWPMLLVPQIAAHDRTQSNAGKPEELAQLYQWEGRDVALESLLQHQPAYWLPQGVASWNDLLVSVVARGLEKEHAPGDLSKWRFGPLHPVEIAHPVFSMSRAFHRLLGLPTGSGPRETGGDANTIKAIGAHFGPSERFDADLADTGAALGNITTGQSGNPASEWYFDQFLPWLNGTSFPLPLHTAGAKHTLTLTP